MSMRHTHKHKHMGQGEKWHLAIFLGCKWGVGVAGHVKSGRPHRDGHEANSQLWRMFA